LILSRNFGTITAKIITLTLLRFSLCNSTFYFLNRCYKFTKKWCVVYAPFKIINFSKV
jgi:hypothetical protein